MIDRINHALVAFYCALRSLLHTRVAAPARGLSMLEYALMALVVVAAFVGIMTFFPGFLEEIFGRIGNDIPGGEE